ncbi:UNVERIFIED_CONTAM: hypothetical protein H355_004646 [Colinus virginianus]|nr:hypothetical protein H355_004646 [Colinus virginianus]
MGRGGDGAGVYLSVFGRNGFAFYYTLTSGQQSEAQKQGEMPAPEQTPMVDEGPPQTAQETSTSPGMEPEATATTILASVKEQPILALRSATACFSNHSELVEAEMLQDATPGGIKDIISQASQVPDPDEPGHELQFQRLTRELEVERQIVANQLERCRLGAESPSIASTSSGKCFDFVSKQPPASIASSRAMRRVSSVPSRAQSPSYVVSTGLSPSRGSLRTSLGSGYGSPSVAEQRSLASHAYSSTTLPVQRAASPYAAQRPASPVTVRRIGSITSRQTANPNGGGSQFQASARVGSPLALADVQTRVASPPQTQLGSSSPKRSAMTAVPQHLGTTLQRTVHDIEQYGQQYDMYERMVPPRPDSLTGLRSSYASQHSQLGQELRSAVSPELHITPIYEGRTYYSPVYRSPNHGTVELHQGSQSALYRTGSGRTAAYRSSHSSSVKPGSRVFLALKPSASRYICYLVCFNTNFILGVGNLQRSSSQRSTLTYQRNNYALNTTATYAEPYRSMQYRLSEPGYSRLPHAAPADDGTTRSPSIDSIQKDPRQVLLRFPTCRGMTFTVLVCRLGGIKHLVDLLDHRVLEVQKNACGALRNLVYGKSTDENKIAMKNVGGIPALLRLLRKSVDAEIKELVTGVLWNLSSCDAVKMTIIRDALSTLTNTVIVPHSGWNSASFDDDHKMKFQTSLVLRNTTGCLRNLSSAGEEARKQMRSCEGLVDSLLYVIHTCVKTSDYDSKTVENCVCTLRNLSYRLELEVPQARLLGINELDDLLGKESPSKDSEPSCWGKKKKKKKKTSQEDQWDGVGPIPGFSKSPKGVEMLWHPSVVKPYLTLLAESSNPATLEGSAGSLQNLSAGNWKFAAYIRAAVRKEKGLPILVELLRMDNDRVVSSVATALRNMALDVRNKELIGKYAMRDLVNRLPGGSGPSILSDETVAAICCALHEVTSKNMENAKALADTGGIEKLVNITKGRGDRSSLKVVKAAAQVLNTLWQYRDLRSIYKKDGWNQSHFITPVSTLERERFKSHPSLSTANQQMSPVIQSVGSTSSSPALLGIREPRSEYDRTQPSMQYYNHGDIMAHKDVYTGSSKTSPIYISSYSSPAREQNRRLQHQQLYYSQEDTNRKNYDPYRLYLQSPHSYEDPYFDDRVHFPATSDYATQYGLKSTTNYVDFYSTRRSSYRAEQYPGSPDSWV